MSDKIPDITASVDLLRSVIWQYDSATSLKTLIEQKNAWYLSAHSEFWSDWFIDVFDLRTANDFGLSIWAIILGINFYIPDCPGTALTTDQKRLVCRLRYYQLITRCTIPEINATMADLFTTDNGTAYALDPLDMSHILYVFTAQPDSTLALILAKYDLLPRPATVGIGHRVIRYRPFGFGRHYQNFNHAPFWDGGHLDSYYGRIVLSYDEDSHQLHGTLIASDKDISVSDTDTTLIYTGADGEQITHYTVTDDNGQFTDYPPFNTRFTVTARAQLRSPLCDMFNVESRPYTVVPTGKTIRALVTHNGRPLLTNNGQVIAIDDQD